MLLAYTNNVRSHLQLARDYENVSTLNLVRVRTKSG